MLEQRIQQQFFESADLQYQVAESLSRPISDAAQMLVEAITAGGRVLCAGLGLAELDARYLAAQLMGRFEQDRPGLAALHLDGRVQQGSGSIDVAAALARQVQTLGHPGDLLLLLDAYAGSEQQLPTVLDAARGQDMSVILLSGSQDEALRAALLDTDIQIRIPHSRGARVAEAFRLVSHCLCDAIDVQLLGAAE
ncbi:SIS domain-containing protein [Paucibacter sp. APW11]|uniref:SIS domain-containing protein n=1 Tax=Roseateles aquae TaxID=3077235 RepID=A0ABU3PIL2_9BURK|nr:SIS domain-containing protein [Paucibacter sp. APW11]MDT9002202.1 SIS domain-containing protein [Paucibacter sp. APW11]